LNQQRLHAQKHEHVDIHAHVHSLTHTQACTQGTTGFKVKLLVTEELRVHIFSAPKHVVVEPRHDQPTVSMSKGGERMSQTASREIHPLWSDRAAPNIALNGFLESCHQYVCNYIWSLSVFFLLYRYIIPGMHRYIFLFLFTVTISKFLLYCF
jgi:hypothetical protein